MKANTLQGNLILFEEQLFLFYNLKRLFTVSDYEFYFQKKMFSYKQRKSIFKHRPAPTQLRQRFILTRLERIFI